MPTKVCRAKIRNAKIPGCGRELPLSSFMKASHLKDGHENVCKDCRNEYARQVYRDNPEKMRTQKKKDNAKYRANNLEKRREQVNKSVSKFQKNNPWHNVKKAQKRRAKRLNQLGVMPNDALEILEDLFGYQCMNPFCAFDHDDTNPVTLDHIIPLAQGGLHDIGNIQFLCKRYNSSKSDKLILDFRLFKYEYEG